MAEKIVSSKTFLVNVHDVARYRHYGDSVGGARCSPADALE